MRSSSARWPVALATLASSTYLAASLAAQDRVITITATEYEFEAPDTVAAGVVQVRLLSAGEEFHHAQLVRLEDGKTVSDLQALIGTHGADSVFARAPSWVKWIGGPNGPMPGGESNVTVALRAGTYAWICFIRTNPPERAPHFMKGMLREMTVTGSGRPRLPQGDVLLMLSDYDFELSRPLAAGRQTVRVRNMAGQRHEVIFIQLHPGKTQDDLLAYLASPTGPPPANAMGGTGALDDGEVNLVELDLTPGNYAMLCFVSDVRDGKPHIEHGMIKSFSVP